MSTDLEKYLDARRKELDVEQPDEQLIWEGIRQDLQRSGSRSNRKKLFTRIRNLAAVLIIMISVGYMIVDLIGDRKPGMKITLSDIDRALGDREQEYRTLVSFKQHEAAAYNHTDNMIIAELYEEIHRLDTIYQQSMKDLLELGYDERVINTIFDTYEKKIYLLELIILENNKIRNHETDENIFF
jgi:hypothetical protein